MQAPNQNSRKKQPPTNWAKYSSMGFQMAAIIGVGVFAGVKLDAWLDFKKVPIFTLLFSLLSVFAAMWYFVKDFLKKK